MVNCKIIPYLFACILLIGAANAALISGSVYDLSFNKPSNVIVTINTTTKQLIVLHNGSYSFGVPNGFYTINARLMEKNIELSSASENISVEGAGSYNLYLILYPDFKELEESIESIDLDTKDAPISHRKRNTLIVLSSLVVILAVSYYLFTIKKNHKNNIKNQHQNQIAGSSEQYQDVAAQDQPVLDQILDILKKEDGRSTQKSIRKQIPLSEAKISLVISELEHKGFIEKIKKGRGNIIILKKK